MENPKNSEERIALTTKSRDPPGPAQDKPMEEEEDAEETRKEENRDEDDEVDEVELNYKDDAATVPTAETANAIAEEAAADVDGDYYNSTISALSEDRWEEMYQKLLEFKVSGIRHSIESSISCSSVGDHYSPLLLLFLLLHC